MSLNPWRETPQGLILRVHLQPRASRDRLLGYHGDALKIALTAPPVENAANVSLLSFLAILLRIPRSSLRLLSGAKSREKQVLLPTDAPKLLRQRLEQLLSRVDKKMSDG